MEGRDAFREDQRANIRACLHRRKFRHLQHVVRNAARREEGRGSCRCREVGEVGGTNKMRTKLAIVTTCLVLLAAVPAAMAHHAFAAEFDVTKPVTLKGTMEKW